MVIQSCLIVFGTFEHVLSFIMATYLINNQLQHIYYNQSAYHSRCEKISKNEVFKEG